MQQLLRRLDKSFKAFFRRVKNGEKPGFPRSKHPDRFHSIEFKPKDGCQIKEIENKNKLFITHVGPVRIKWHRDFPEQSVLKHIVVSRKHSKWFICLQIEIPDSINVSGGSQIGIDLGISHLITTSDGEHIDSPKHYVNGQKRLRVLQRSVSRKKRGSKNRQKAVRLLGKHHEYISNCRDDFLHKTTRHLVDNYGPIVMEDLSLGFMLKNRHLAKHASDVAMGKFTSFLEYKAEEAGVQVIKVDPKYTSQECSECGKRVKKTLSERVHNCPHCDLEIDRDHNAAKNILKRGASLLESLTCHISECVGSQAHGFSRG